MPHGGRPDKELEERRERERRALRRAQLAIVADPSLEREAREILAGKLAGRPYAPPDRKRRKHAHTRTTKR